MRVVGYARAALGMEGKDVCTRCVLVWTVFASSYAQFRQPQTLCITMGFDAIVANVCKRPFLLRELLGFL